MSRPKIGCNYFQSNDEFWISSSSEKRYLSIITRAVVVLMQTFADSNWHPTEVLARVSLNLSLFAAICWFLSLFTEHPCPMSFTLLNSSPYSYPGYFRRYLHHFDHFNLVGYFHFRSAHEFNLDFQQDLIEKIYAPITLIDLEYQFIGIQVELCHYAR